jgi:hypothetical protein
MNDKFAERLDSFLDSEARDYSMSFSWQWNDDCNCCEVLIKSELDATRFKEINFKYDEENDDLKIELCEDSYYTTREFDETVKYFWMLVAPAIFPEN